LPDLPDAASLIAEFHRVNGSAGPAASATAAPLPPPFPNGSAAAVQAIVMPNELAKNSAPTIQLAGLDWPIPLLAPRQNRIVVPAVSKITKRMRETAEAKLAQLDDETKAVLLQLATPGEVEEKGADAVLRKRIWAMTDFSFEMAHALEPEFFDTICDALYWALTRAHPQLTRQQFDDMPIGMLEMIDAIGMVAQQTGMMKRVDPSAGPLAGGATPSPSSPTSTP
jgi:hypothetical protein